MYVHRVPGPLELKLQMFVSYRVGTKPRSSVCATRVLKHRAIRLSSTYREVFGKKLRKKKQTNLS